MKKGLFRKGNQILSFLSRLPLLHKTGISLVTVTAVSLVIVTLSSSPAHSEPPPTDGLVGYWNFDDGSGTTAADSSGNGHQGTVSGGASWTAEKVGGGLSFDGVNGVVTIPHSSELNPNGAYTRAFKV